VIIILSLILLNATMFCSIFIISTQTTHSSCRKSMWSSTASS